jgi:hypothetical protein
MDQETIKLVIGLLDKAKRELLEQVDSAPKRKKKEYTAAFLSFWDCFPSKVKGSKAKAFLAYGRLSSQDKLAAAWKAGDFIESNKKHNPGYFIHASTYLNQRRWMDDETEETYDTGAI